MPKEPWTMDDEREHLEEILNNRFNYYLVFVSLLLAATFGSSSITQDQRALALLFGTIVSGVLGLLITRTRHLVAKALRQFKSYDPQHPYWVLFHAVEQDPRIFRLLKRSAYNYLFLAPLLITLLLAVLCVYTWVCPAGGCWKSSV